MDCSDKSSHGQSKSCPGAAFKRAGGSAAAFVRDYVDRHKNPVNAALHLVGVPAVFYGIFCAATGRSSRDRNLGMALIVFGYVLQYLGHKKQGNEVGEVTLIKFLLAKLGDATMRRMRGYKWVSEGGMEEKRGPAGAVAHDVDPVAAGAKKEGHNGNGHNGGNGHGNGSSGGRYILWWKTSH